MLIMRPAFERNSFKDHILVICYKQSSMGSLSSQGVDVLKGRAFRWLQWKIVKRSSLLCEECQAKIVPSSFGSSFKALCLLAYAGPAGSLRSRHFRNSE